MAELTMIRNSSQLSSSNRCTRKKSFPWVMKEDSDVIKRVAAEKKVLIEALFSGARKNYMLANKSSMIPVETARKALLLEIRTNLEKEYDNMGVMFDFASQKTAILKMMSVYIARYVISEYRTPIQGQLIPRVNFNLPELNDIVGVRPDLVYYTSENGQETIEAVIIKTGKSSNFTQKGKKRDGSPENSLELYLLWCYARILAKPGQKTNIKASYYFLKSTNDFKKGKGLEDNDYFMAKSVIYSLEDSVTKNAAGKYKLSYTDVSFKDQLIEFDKGIAPEECTKEDCARCTLAPFCNYNASPVFKVKEKKQSKMRAVDFSESQQEVIKFRKGYGVVNAGAGAGKTAVVTYCVESYAEEGGAERDLLCITFTNNGAGEMRDRIEATLIDNGMEDTWDVSKLQIKTFNAFCNDIILDEYDKLGFSAAPRVIEEVERADIIKTIADKYQFDGIDYATFTDDSIGLYAATGKEIVTAAFDYIKSNKLSAGDEDELKKGLQGKYWNAMQSSFTCLTQLLQAYNEYDSLLRANNLIEYADQELLLFELLQQNPYYLEQFKFKHIIVDEFQDTSSQQVEILKQLIDTPSFESILVVGDDSQAIYGFRGTGPEHLINFFDEVGAPEDERFVFNLIDNYRCTPEIIDAANKINAKNEHRVIKDLKAYRKSMNKPVVVKGFFEKEEEYSYIVESIKQQLKDGREPSQIAVLGRNKNILTKVGELLSKESIPCVNMNPEPILENSKVIAAIELAKAIDNPTLSRSVMVYLNCKYENTLLQFKPKEIKKEVDDFTRRLELVSKLPEKKKLEEFMSMLDDINYDEDELYEHFIESLKFRVTFKSQLEYIKLTEKYGKKQTYKREKDYPGVVLTTMHSAKGLEWECVYMIMDTLDDEKLHRYSPKSEAEIEETRRLIFVSMTRARDELYVTGLFNITERSKVHNQFLKEIYNVLGEDETYKIMCVDPNAEVKKAMKEVEKAQEKVAAAERKAKMLQEAEESNLISTEDILAPLEINPTKIVSSSTNA